MDSESSHNPSSSHEEDTSEDSHIMERLFNDDEEGYLILGTSATTESNDSHPSQATTGTAAAALLDMNAQGSPASNLERPLASTAMQIHQNSQQIQNGHPQQLFPTANAASIVQQQANMTPQQHAHLPDLSSAEQRGQFCPVVHCHLSHFLSLLLLIPISILLCFVIAFFFVLL